MGAFIASGSLFHDGVLLIEYESLQWNELDFKNYFETILSTRKNNDIPINLIVRGLPGSGKTFLSDFSASSILRCLSIDIDKFRKRGKINLEPRDDGEDLSIFFQLIDASFFLGINTVISGCFASVENTRYVINPEAENFIMELNIGIDDSLSNNINEVSKVMIESYASNWETVAGIKF